MNYDYDKLSEDIGHLTGAVMALNAVKDAQTFNSLHRQKELEAHIVKVTDDILSCFEKARTFDTKWVASVADHTRRDVTVEAGDIAEARRKVCELMKPGEDIEELMEVKQ